MVNLSLRDRSAVLRFVEKFCFPLVREYSIPTALVGTASLLHVNSRHYLVSAAHVLKILKANLNDIGVPLGKRKAIVYVLGSMSFAIPDPPQDKKFDIGVALLDVPHAVTKLKRSPWKVLIPEHIGRTSPYTDAFAFVGFRRDLRIPLLVRCDPVVFWRFHRPIDGDRFTNSTNGFRQMLFLSTKR